ncbi:hypothetical protein E3A20_15360, partial [Planctomyces bekefii]
AKSATVMVVKTLVTKASGL